MLDLQLYGTQLCGCCVIDSLSTSPVPGSRLLPVEEEVKQHRVLMTLHVKGEVVDRRRCARRLEELLQRDGRAMRL